MNISRIIFHVRHLVAVPKNHTVGGFTPIETGITDVGGITKMSGGFTVVENPYSNPEDWDIII